MRTLFHPALLHPPGEDPGLWVDLPDEGRAVLLDLPALELIPSRKLARVAHAVVTHTHMDHFIGFDHLLRAALRREELLTVTGPEGFLDSVRGRIGAYAWNLIEGYPVTLRIQEIARDGLRAEEYRGSTRMRPQPAEPAAFTGCIHAERGFRIDVAVLDHGIPVLGVALREVEHLAVNKDRLEREGLVPGPWLGQLKDLVRRESERSTPVAVALADGSTARRESGPLADDLIVRGPGQVVVYLTDVAGTETNFERATDLARGADLLVCEAVFLHADLGLAAERRHLTARQAGELARRAGVKRLAVFHGSPRYHGREADLAREAADAFGNPLLELPIATIRP